jgi:hypothetical protein
MLICVLILLLYMRPLLYMCAHITSMYVFLLLYCCQYIYVLTTELLFFFCPADDSDLLVSQLRAELFEIKQQVAVAT